MKHVEDFIRQNMFVRSSLIKSDDDQLQLKRDLQHFLSMKPFVGIEQKFYENILSHAASAEKSSPGAGKIFLERLLVSDTKNKIYCRKINNRESLRQRFVDLGFEDSIIFMLISALEMSTVNTVFSIKKSTNSNSYIEYTEGYRFAATNLVDQKKTLKLKKAKIVCIDGYVESVSEIHHLLQKASEINCNVVLMSRGMSDDVRHTIKVNVDRGSLMLFPYLVSFNLEYCNTLVDIAVASGGDVISTNKGQLISTIELEKMSDVDECICSSGMIVIKNEKSKNSVNNHISNIKKNRDERPELEEFLTDRIRTLTSSCMEICIPEDLSSSIKTKQLDEGIRIISSIINRKLSDEDVVNQLLDSYRNIVKNTVFTNLEF